MSYTPHSVGLSDGAIGAFVDPGGLQGGWLSGAIAIGSTLWAIEDCLAQDKVILYKSTDGGANWVNMATLSYSHPGVYVQGFWTRVVVYHEGLLTMIGAYQDHLRADGVGAWFGLDITTVDPTAGSPSFTPWTTLLFQASNPLANGTFDLFARIRNDGKLLLGYSDAGSDIALPGSDIAPHFQTLSSGTWTDLGRVNPPSGTGISVANGLVTLTGLVYVFFTEGAGGVAGPPDQTITMRIIDDATDSISAPQTITAVGGLPNEAVVMSYKTAGTLTATGLCIGYARQKTDLVEEGHVLFGDTTITPLSPTWTDTVYASASGGAPPYPEAPAVVVEGGVLRAYFRSIDVSAATLYRSDWSGSAWGTPVLWFDPSSFYSGSNQVVADYQLVPVGWSITFGIMTQVGYGAVQLSYDGPPVGSRKNNYVSSGNILVAAGKYVA